MKTKLTTILTLSLLFSFGILYAQQPESWLKKQTSKIEADATSMVVKNRVNKMTESLHLSDAQKEKITSLLTTCLDKLKAVHAKMKTDEAAAKKEAQAIVQKADSDVENVLTAEQKTKYQTLKQQLPPLK